jgi:hypothetical protein
MPGRCAIWARVSTDEQDAGNQLAELRQWADRRGLEVVAEYVLDGASAWKGEHREQLGLAVADARLGRNRFRRLAFAANLPPVSLHSLRHGAATYALAAGVDIKVVQERLGHSTSTLTRDTYTSVLPDVARAAAEAAAAMIPRAVSGTDGLPTDSQALAAASLRKARSEKMQVKTLTAGGAPGARTQNPRIKSPLLYH